MRAWPHVRLGTTFPMLCAVCRPARAAGSAGGRLQPADCHHERGSVVGRPVLARADCCCFGSMPSLFKPHAIKQPPVLPKLTQTLYPPFRSPRAARNSRAPRTMRHVTAARTLNSAPRTTRPPPTRTSGDRPPGTGVLLLLAGISRRCGQPPQSVPAAVRRMPGSCPLGRSAEAHSSSSRQTEGAWALIARRQRLRLCEPTAMVGEIGVAGWVDSIQLCTAAGQAINARHAC